MNKLKGKYIIFFIQIQYVVMNLMLVQVQTTNKIILKKK